MQGQLVRAMPRPLAVGSLGAYAVQMSSGTIGAGITGGSTVYSFRWGSSVAGLECHAKRVLVAVASLGTGFTAGIGFLDMIVARAFTASDTGGSAATLTTNNGKRRTAFGTTLLTNMQIANIGAITPGTRTLDAQAMASARFAVPTSANTVLLATTEIWNPDMAKGEHPLVLVQNEGFIIRATVPATGTWVLDVTVEWQEIQSPSFQ